MKKLIALAMAALALSFSGPAWAQQSIPGAKSGPSGSPAQVSGVSPIVAPAAGAFGIGRPVAEDNGLPVNCLSGCSGSGGGTTTKATAADPTLVEGSTANQLSVDLTGYSRAKVKGSVSLTGSLPDTAAGDLAAINSKTGTPTDSRPAAAGITVADSGSTTTAGQNGVNLITGTPTAGSVVDRAIVGQSAGAITVTATSGFTGIMEGSADLGVSYVAISGLQRGTAITGSSITGIGVFSLDVTGLTNLRVRGTGGTATLRMTFSPAPGMTKILNPTREVDSTGTEINDTINHARKTTVQAITTGGATPYHLITAASTNSTLISTGAHTLLSLQLSGLNATAGWLRAYDLAAAPTCSSSTGAVHSWPVIGSATQQGGLIIALPAQGEAYLLGLAFCFTGGSADTDNTSGPSGVSINASYK